MNRNTIIPSKVKILKLIIIVSLWLMFLTILYAVVSSSFGGLDITDDSFYLIGYLYRIEPIFTYSYFHKIYNVFFGFLDFSIISIRILKIGLLLLSGFVLAYSLLKYLEKEKLTVSNKKNLLFVLPSISISSLITYTWYPQSLSYDSFSQIFIQMIVAFYFLGQSTTDKKRTIYQLLIGILLGASFYNKFPNLVTSVIPILVFSFLSKSNQGFTKAIVSLGKDLLIYAVGFFVFSFLLFGSNSIQEFENFIKLLASDDKPLPSHNYFEMYFQNLYEMYIRGKWYWLAIGIYTVLGYRIRSKVSPKLYDIFNTIFFISILLFFIITQESYMGGVSISYVLFDIYCLSIFIFISSLLLYSNNRVHQIFGICTFLCMFLSNTLGTDSTLTSMMMIYVVFVVIAFLVVTLSLRKIYLYALSSIVVCVASSQIITAIFFDPYREMHGLGDSQQYEVKGIKGFEGMKLDSALFDLKEKLIKVKTAEEKFIFTYSHELGVALLTEKKPYSFGWHSPGNVANSLMLINHSEKIKEEDLLFIIPSRIEIDSMVVNALKKRGISYYKNYKLADKIVYERCQDKAIDTLNIYAYKGSALLKN